MNAILQRHLFVRASFRNRHNANKQFFRAYKHPRTRIISPKHIPTAKSLPPAANPVWRVLGRHRAQKNG